MTAGFAVLAHDDPAMLSRLLDRIGPAFPVVVHLDRRQDVVAYDRVAGVGKRTNVRYATSRGVVHWGGDSIVDAMEYAFTSLSAEMGARGHVVWLSGRCYPVRPVEEFVGSLRGGTSPDVLARAYDAQTAGRWHVQRYTRRHFFEDDVVIRLPAGRVRGSVRRALSWASQWTPRDVPMRVAIGSNWMALPIACAKEAFDASRSTKYAALRNGYGPDEMVLQTYIHNSRWSVRTPDGGTVKLQDPKVSDLPNFHVLTKAMRGRPDEGMLLNPGPSAYFARKFSSTDDEAILRRIDERLGV